MGKLVSVSTVSEKLRITGSLAYRLIRKLANEGTLKKRYDSGGFLLYTKSAKQLAKEKEEKAKAEAAAAEKAAKKGKEGRKTKEGQERKIDDALLNNDDI